MVWTSNKSFTRCIMMSKVLQLMTLTSYQGHKDTTNAQNSMETTIFIRDTNGVVPYWACDETLPLAKARYKRLSGKYPSKKASIIAFTGTSEQIDAIRINDLGDISYPKDITKIVLQ